MVWFISDAKTWDPVQFPTWRHLVLLKIIWASLPGQHLVQKTQHLLQVLPSLYYTSTHRAMWTIIQLEADNGDLLLHLGCPWISQGASFGRWQNSAWVTTEVLAFLFSSTVGRRSRKGNTSKGCAGGSLLTAISSIDEAGGITCKSLNSSDNQDASLNILGNSSIAYRNQNPSQSTMALTYMPQASYPRLQQSADVFQLLYCGAVLGST